MAEGKEVKFNRNTTIDKVKVSDEGVIIEYTETVVTETWEGDQLVGEDKNRTKKRHDSDFRPHKDFVAAMKMLRKPVIDICDLGDYKNFDKYRIYGVSFSGEQDDAKVIISAGKEVDWSGMVFNFVTPLTPLHDNDGFKSSKQLDGFCANIIAEAKEYMNGKHSENPQLTISFESGENAKLQVQD
jgi:hypothetical protein